jgi:hypothetical protein
MVLEDGVQIALTMENADNVNRRVRDAIEDKIRSGAYRPKTVPQVRSLPTQMWPVPQPLRSRQYRLELPISNSRGGILCEIAPYTGQVV